ncbi:MAG TPA: DUF393 domain-containing protein [Candidatus Deferrimicrobium sp.]|nr:DUF393 domain-containing protein [Candidatus Deferrimicrobium sp.]
MSEYYLIYDDTCPLCVSSVEKVRKRDAQGRIACVSLTNAKQLDDVVVPPPSDLLREIHLISRDGHMYRGAEALARLAMILPRWRVAGRLLMLPVVKNVAAVVYYLIARHRHRL